MRGNCSQFFRDNQLLNTKLEIRQLVKTWREENYIAWRNFKITEILQKKDNINLDFAFLTLGVKAYIFKSYRLLQIQAFPKTQGHL